MVLAPSPLTMLSSFLLLCSFSLPQQTLDAEVSYCPLGTDIGVAGLEFGLSQGVPEIYVSGSSDRALTRNWHVLEWDPAKEQYRQSFISRVYREGLAVLVLGQVLGDGAPEIVVATGDGWVEYHDQATRELLFRFPCGGEIRALALTDFEADGSPELVALNRSGIHAFSAPDGAPIWSLPGAFGEDLTIGQMDQDPSRDRHQ